MKKAAHSLLFISLLISWFFSFSQNDDYIPLVNEDNTWSIMVNTSAGGGGLVSFYVKIGDTTVIQGKEYQKVYITYDSIGLVDAWDFVGYINEDIESEKCYFMNLQSQEGLIYDFSADTGDTLSVWNTFYQYSLPPFDAVVLEKDSVFIGDVYRKRLNIMIIGGYGSEYWIEGIGSTNGLLYSGNVFIGAKYSLLCFFENNELIFHDPFYENCYYGINTGFTLHNNKVDNLNIWPNPVLKGQKLFIEIPFAGNSENNCYLIDSKGRCVDSFHFKGSNCCYSLPSQPEGLVIIRIQTINTSYQLKLLIK